MQCNNGGQPHSAAVKSSAYRISAPLLALLVCLTPVDARAKPWHSEYDATQLNLLSMLAFSRAECLIKSGIETRFSLRELTRKIHENWELPEVYTFKDHERYRSSIKFSAAIQRHLDRDCQTDKIPAKIYWPIYFSVYTDRVQELKRDKKELEDKRREVKCLELELERNRLAADSSNRQRRIISAKYDIIGYRHQCQFSPLRP